MANADWVAKVRSSSIVSGGNSPGRLRDTTRHPMSWSSRAIGTARMARIPDSSRFSRSRLPYFPGMAMSGIWAGASVMAVCPTTPSPLRTRVVRRASARVPPVSVAARWTNSSVLSSYSNTTPPSNPDRWTARETMVVSTVSRSSVELTARPTSPSAVSFSTDCVSSAVRVCSSVNRRTFSMAMTAWSAKVSRSSIWRGVNPPVSVLRRKIVPIATPSRNMGAATAERMPCCRASRRDSEKARGSRSS